MKVHRLSSLNLEREFRFGSEKWSVKQALWLVGALLFFIAVVGAMITDTQWGQLGVDLAAFAQFVASMFRELSATQWLLIGVVFVLLLILRELRAICVVCAHYLGAISQVVTEVEGEAAVRVKSANLEDE